MTSPKDTHSESTSRDAELAAISDSLASLARAMRQLGEFSGQVAERVGRMETRIDTLIERLTRSTSTQTIATSTTARSKKRHRSDPNREEPSETFPLYSLSQNSLSSDTDRISSPTNKRRRSADSDEDICGSTGDEHEAQEENRNEREDDEALDNLSPGLKERSDLGPEIPNPNEGHDDRRRRNDGYSSPVMSSYSNGDVVQSSMEVSTARLNMEKDQGDEDGEVRDVIGDDRTGEDEEEDTQAAIA